jgi:hypothetical protein
MDEPKIRDVVALQTAGRFRIEIGKTKVLGNFGRLLKVKDRVQGDWLMLGRIQ